MILSRINFIWSAEKFGGMQIGFPSFDVWVPNFKPTRNPVRKPEQASWLCWSLSLQIS
jgi:hypothetical protein